MWAESRIIGIIVIVNMKRHFNLSDLNDTHA
jgi:hypothetical protein